jgi:2,3-bisphosphoglycerate-dependent phosphoglycerate mutase
MSAHPATTTVYLVRHAHSDWQPNETRPLSAGGGSSARALADQLAHIPIAAIYSSPARRALETIEPLARHLQLQPVILMDLRERELSASTAAEFHAAVAASWKEPDVPFRNGESNTAAQIRGVAILRKVLDEHPNQHVVLSTHGTLLTLVLNALDTMFGYDFWRTLTFPDAYGLSFSKGRLARVRRVWNPEQPAMAFQRPVAGESTSS